MSKDLGLKPLSQEGGMEEEGREMHLFIDLDDHSLQCHPNLFATYWCLSHVSVIITAPYY